jgi:hypothetical protein
MRYPTPVAASDTSPHTELSAMDTAKFDAYDNDPHAGATPQQGQSS